MQAVSTLPYFNLSDLMPYSSNHHYLKTMLGRYNARRAIIRLKKGLYASQKYVDQTKISNYYPNYLEFIANQLSAPSYLSLDYVLAQHNILTEMPANFTSITVDKPGSYINALGKYFYHSIKPELFCGYLSTQDHDLTINKATKAKALFDYLYLRKNSLNNRSAIEELRLNLNHLSPADWREFKKYCNISRLSKMKVIYTLLTAIK